MAEKKKNSNKKITKDMKVSELLEVAPEKVDVLYEVGMHCIGCFASVDETIEEACMVHGIDPDDVVQELNEYEPEDENENN